MTFIEWTEREEHSNQNAANPKTMKIRQENVTGSQAKTLQPQEKSHAKK